MDAITAAKLVSVGIAFSMAGYGISASQSALPIIYDQPASVSTHVFAQIYYRGTQMMLPGSVLSSGASAYLAYAFPEQRGLWATAGGLVFAIGPFTQLVMHGGIHRLIHISEGSAVEQEKAEKDGEVLSLLKTWNAQNWLRVALNLSGGAIGLWTVLNGGALH